MRLHRIQLENFKGVVHREITFPDTGVTVLLGRNESGKSSTVEAFDLLLEALPTSRSKDVLAARPEGQDVGVTVEAEFSIGQHRVTYRKRWLKSSGAELSYISGPRAGHTLTGREAHDSVQDLLDTSDRTLWKALRLLQSQKASEDFAGSSALRRALEAGAGHPAEDATGTTVLEAARAERARYFTDRGKERGETTTLRNRYGQAVEDQRRAESRLGQIAAAVETHDRQAVEADSAKATVVAAREALETAQSESAAIKELEQQRRTAQVALEVAQSQAERAVQDHRARVDLLERVSAAEQRVEDARDALDRLRADARNRDAGLERSRVELTRARDAERAAREVESGARRAEQRARDRAQMAHLHTTLAELDALAQESANAAVHETSGITREVLDGIESAQRELELAESQLQAGSAQLVVTALNAQRAVTVDGQERTLEADQSWQRAVTEPVSVEIPGQLRVVVEPEGGLQARQARVQAARDAVDSALAAAGVTNLAQAREACERDREHERLLSTHRERRHLILQGRDETTLRDEYRALSAAVDSAADRTTPDAPAAHGDGSGADDAADSVSALGAVADNPDITPGDPAVLRVELEAATEQVDSARQVVMRREQDLQQAETAAHKVHTALTQAMTDHVSEQRVHADLVEQLNTARAKQDDSHLAAHAHDAEQQRLHAHTTLEALNTRWGDSNAEHILALERAQQTRLTNARHTWEAAQAAKSRAEGALKALDRDQRQRDYDSAVTQRRSLARELRAHLRRAAAAKLLADTLENFQAQAHRRYNAPFRQQLELLGRAVFGSTFQVELADDLTITRRGLNGTWLEVRALSTGAREQLDVLIRLAVATLVDPEDGVPVILDDALGHSDPHRLVSLASAVEAAGSRAQVIILTATPDRFSSVPGAETVRIEDPSPAT